MFVKKALLAVCCLRVSHSQLLSLSVSRIYKSETPSSFVEHCVKMRQKYFRQREAALPHLNSRLNLSDTWRMFWGRATRMKAISGYLPKLRVPSLAQLRDGSFLSRAIQKYEEEAEQSIIRDFEVCSMLCHLSVERRAVISLFCFRANWWGCRRLLSGPTPPSV